MILKNIDILNSDFTISFDCSFAQLINDVYIVLVCQQGRFISDQRIWVESYKTQETINYIKHMVFQHLVLNPNEVFDLNKCIHYDWPKEYCIE